ncbi:MAG: hypothetical protein JJE09_15480 [Bacteroidia bacterium]|nr:hypothetical protein [Bacteroidia bacterium]
MKNKIILSAMVLILTTLTCVFAQPKKSYVEGTISGADLKLKGYFWFSNSLSNGAQLISYMETLDATRQTLNAKQFERFESADLYLEKFDVAHANSSHGAEVLIPRIAKGKINLFKYTYVADNQKHNLNQESHYYIHKGIVKTQITYNNFKEKMEELINDNLELLQKVRNNDLSYYKLQLIISEYNGNTGGAGGSEVSSE